MEFELVVEQRHLVRVAGRPQAAGVEVELAAAVDGEPPLPAEARQGLTTLAAGREFGLVGAGGRNAWPGRRCVAVESRCREQLVVAKS
jgi:hypothetical protein